MGAAIAGCHSHDLPIKVTKQVCSTEVQTSLAASIFLFWQVLFIGGGAVNNSYTWKP